MAKNLVIVESPAKWKTIEKFLWKDYKVVASMGHIRDLPKKSLWIDIDNNFAPEYNISEDKEKTVNNLLKLAKSAQTVWIATDEDREGEAIWWHLCHALNLDPKTTQRIVFHEITKSAIIKAVENPRTIDLNLVDAQQARRLLDRLVWYKVSPVLWQKIRKGLSAGRVQSVATKLIVEKEREILTFTPEESWKITVSLNFDGNIFDAVLTKVDGKVKKLKTQQDVQKVLATIIDNILSIKQGKTKRDTISLSHPWILNFKLVESIKKDSIRKPWAPFTTSTIQQEWARKFGFGVKQTMMIAQKLYEGIDLWSGDREGLITYMRTDSLNLSELALTQARDVITKDFWAQYHKKRTFTTKSAGAQEAHEAIRPTDLSRTPESLKWDLDAQQLKLYSLIWKRTLASQMADAVVEVTTYNFSPEKNLKQTWTSKGEVITFDGFMKLYIEGTDDEDDDSVADGMLPAINEGEILSAKSLNASQNFSRPPARFTEASLVKRLEWEGIGRPSTYAPTISTIIDRGYVEKTDKKYLAPTETAFTVTDFLEKYFSQMMEYKFTKSVEEDFDKIASGKEEFQTMLGKFWEWTLKKNIEEAWDKAEKVIELVGKKCPTCWNDLIYKFSKSGKFIGCSWYPECKHIEQPKEEKDALDFLRNKYEGKPCPDGVEGTVVVKTGRFWPFLASSEYPKVKWIGKIKSEKDELLEEILAKKWLLIDEESGEEMVVKGSKRWPFLAAKNYPDVKIAKNIPKDVWDELNAQIAEKQSEEENQVSS